MSEETNTEHTTVESTPQVSAAPEGAAPDEAEAPKPRRRTRKAKSADQPASERVGDNGSESSGEVKKPARRGRPRKSDVEKAAAPARTATESTEVMQARALAQISQASVVRRQRRAAERAAEMLTGGFETSAGNAPEPTPAPFVSAPSAVPTAPKVSVAPSSATGSEAAPVFAPSKKGASSDAKAAESKPAEAAQADAKPGASALGQITIPFVDPALRPHRRGRKPKAYVEAEKAAAAALAAAQAAARGEAVPGNATVAGESSATPVAVPAPAAPTSVQDRDVASDVRPGRGARAHKAAEKTAEAAADRHADEKAEQGESKDAAASNAQQQNQQPRRSHQGRRNDGGAPGSQNGNHGDRFDRNDRNERNDRNDRSDRNNGKDFNDRRNNRQRNDRNNKRNNNRFAPAEPSLTRDELAAMKVAELRDKAKELEIDITGKKKAELVEEVYLAAARAEGFREIEGILDITNEGFGYIRAHGYMPSRDDAFVAANMIRAAGLRAGDYISGTLRPSRPNDKFPGLAKLRSVNGMDPEDVKRRPKFADLTPIYPNEPLKMEHGKESITGRAIDIVSPIGKGQRGLIVSPPKAGKTTILKKICQSISANNPEVHLICLLVDERPEEVTDMERSIKGDVVASTFDMPADNHTRVSELVIERAKRIVEMGGDVVVVLDSITRLARAYNLAAPASGRILSGGVDSAALYPPKRFLGAARNIENGGSLTILASALVDTGSKMDEVIFEEFKGTGNMELKLDRDLADRRIFPAIDPVASGTRNEDLLIDPSMRPFVWGIRRILANMNNTERAAASFIKGLKGTNSNQDFLIRTAKKAADHETSL